jgi:DNA-binding response OmpR family regulator
MPSRVLIVEDEPEMRVILRDNLEFEGCEVIAAATGEEGVRLALAERPHLVLLDVMLPKMSGFEACRKMRTSGVTAPIIMLTARNSELDRVAGLELGADDYMGKPFSIPELLARVRAQLRRGEQAARAPHELVVGELEINLKKFAVRRQGRLVDLSAREFDLLRYFVAHRGEVVSRECLLNDVWGYHGVLLTRTVDNFVAKLRKKLESDPQHPEYIVTVHRTGYRFMAE